MAADHESESDGEDERLEPVSGFHALARTVMDEDREVLDALDE